tara:strand:+ start:1991 stop:2182 length:192 start_codon:yes stop_codon:yes gene_type:complete
MKRQIKNTIQEALIKLYDGLDNIDRMNDKNWAIVDAAREVGLKDWAKEKQNEIESELGNLQRL